MRLVSTACVAAGQVLPGRGVYQGAGPFVAEQLDLLGGSAPTVRARSPTLARVG
jgi:hypothetical protein